LIIKTLFVHKTPFVKTVLCTTLDKPHWNYTDNSFRFGGTKEQKRCLQSVKLIFTVKELTRLPSIREVPSLELLGQIIRFSEDFSLPGSDI